MHEEIKGFVLGSVHEPDRRQNIALLRRTLPLLQYEEAIYPAFCKVPFVDDIAARSLERTGHSLNKGEIGCLLGHRNIWRKIAAQPDDKTMFLVLESDSCLVDAAIINRHFKKIAEEYDLFFWGAWEGHMKLLRSTKRPLSGEYAVGTPYIKSVYCTYGYSINRTGARHLLKQTKKVGYPVDQFKRFIRPGDLRIGGAMPELVKTAGRKKSYIQESRNSVKEFFLWLALDFKNALICMLK
ncbi:hypothetical protein GWC95_04225 [Sediminibacterium roseum]|uniref:Glycosyl transferase family 25 domain-containing protein n=1 Tax=Sediminibacterium roseum TaxID=1978412 RepID=A0ABW9ZW61_9BACT|nr:glycosyltransferase family 25 protein [Sediminibacterium roseum]NCI49116.1 hypothetical protein [Sediminibacterium roseum]